MKYAYFYETSMGNIGIAEEKGSITNVFFGNTVKPDAFEEKQTPVLKQAYEQLEEYFAGNRREFLLPLAPEGTAFERQVWEELLKIPFGQTRTYAQLAQSLGNPKACRAVGRANGLNPISIFIPCHRVIGSNGKLTGYAGGLELKERLLKLEGVIK